MVSLEDLRKLPPRAIVAFAARCARRVQPLYQLKQGHPQAGPDKQAVDRAISLAEDFARGKLIANGAAYAAAYAANAAARADDDAANVDAANVDAAARADAAYAAAYAAKAAARADDANVNAAYAYAYAANAFRADAANTAANAFRADAANTAANADYQKLIALNLGPYDTVDPTPSGPLGTYWPNGEPEWSREAVSGGVETTPPARAHATSGGRPDFALVWDPDLLTPAEYAKLVTLIGDVVRAHGGVGVERIRSLGVSVPKGAAVFS